MADSKAEIWKPHPEYTGIEVSTFGRVRTLDRMVCNGKGTWLAKGRVLKQSNNSHGYLQVSVKVGGKWITKRVNRLIAQTFIPNPDSLPEVNHKNCVRDDNRVSNLEWCTHEYNIEYKDKLGHTARNNAPKSPVYAVNLATLEVSRFESQMEASRVLGIHHQNINAVIKGKYKRASGFWFVSDDGHAVDVVKSKLHDIGKTGLKIYN